MSIKAYGTVTVVNVNDGAKGDTGVGVTSVTPMYYLSTSQITPEDTVVQNPNIGGQWVTTKPEIPVPTTQNPTQYYLWTKQVTTLSNGDTVSSAAVCDYTITGIDRRVSEAENKISTKIWQQDIASYISDYDSGQNNPTYHSIRDRVSTTQQSVNSISSTIGEWTTLYQDGNTTIANKVSSIEQTADKIYMLVEADDGSSSQSSSFELTDAAITAITNKFIIKAPGNNPNDATIISGGRIHANAITAAMLATDAIKSTNYTKLNSNTSAYSNTGSYFNLSTGSIETPNFAIYNATNQGEENAAYINGEIIATSGRIGGYGGGTDGYWEIGNKVDASMTQRAAIISHGNTYIQSGMFMLHDRKVNTESFMTTGARNGEITFPNYNYYYNYSNSTENTNTSTYYDYGIQAPQVDSANYNNLFIYGRRIKASDMLVDNNTKLTESQWETYSWDYFFKIDKYGNIYTNGTIYEKGQTLSSRYASISGVDGVYLPLSGGTIDGNLTVVNGTITGTTSRAIGDKNGADITATYLKLSGGTLSGALTVNNTIQANSITASNLYGNLTGNATAATEDSDGNTIVATYIKTLSVSGTTITATRGDNTTFTITTQDTNTDTLVTQAYSTTNNNYPLLMSATSGISSTSSRGAKTTILNNGLYANPSTGIIYATGGFNGNLFGNANTATVATTADKWTTARTITIGDTGKSVDGSDIVSWSKDEISEAASSSSMGWMSSSDKSKLDAIQISSISDVITANSIIGTNGINVTIASGVATISGLFKVPTSSGNNGQVIVSDGTTGGVWTDFSASLITSGTLPVARGGTGQTSAVNAANAFINALSIGNSTPQDDDYYIAQYVGGGTATTTYHRKKVSALWTYIKDKITADTNLNVASATKATQDSDGNAINTTYLKLSGGTMAASAIIDLTPPSSAATWKTGRDKAKIRMSTYSGYVPIASIKTTDGSWDIAPYSENIINFTYVKDTTYSGSSNVYDARIKFTSTGGIDAMGTIAVGSHAVLTYNSTYNCLEFSFV